ncbi:MAG: rRNA maturation RNase YbeY [Bacteroidales bacterium]|jgi:rRNA maturation RNase YbeY|nr:rRNA maturation RNase YbeY [Bacteroidales bacterium]
MVSYFTQDTGFKFKGKLVNNRWLKIMAESESRKLGNINIIFCSDPYILDINKKYLKHNYYTDIITFDYCDGPVLSGDLFISVDTVLANSETYKTDFSDELNRVIIHGVLHLVGYDDQTDEQKAVMRDKEDYYLKIRKLAV